MMKKSLFKAVAMVLVLLLVAIPLSVSAAKKVDAYTIYKATPVVDGKIDDLYRYVGETKITLSLLGDETTNAFGYAKVVWDETFLYAIVDVNDSTVGGGWVWGTSYWDYDSAEVFLDEENNSEGDVPISQFRVATDGLISGMLQHVSCDEAGLRNEYTDFIGKREKNAKGYVVEMAIPWSRIEPKAGTVIGLAFQINDDKAKAGEELGQITSATTAMWDCSTYRDYTLSDETVESLKKSDQASGNTQGGTTGGSGSNQGGSGVTQTIINSNLEFDVIAESETLTLEAVNGTIPDDAMLTVEKVTDIDTLIELKSALAKDAEKITAYSISARGMEPDGLKGKIKGIFTLPDNYDKEKTAILFILPDGKYEIVPMEMQDDGTIIASISKIGTLVVAEKISAVAEEKSDDEKKTEVKTEKAIDYNQIFIMILIVVLALCLIAIVCMYIFVFRAVPAKNKKNSKEEK